MFDIVNENWFEFPDMGTKRYGHFSWVDTKGGKLYVAGGASEINGQPLTSVEVYDIPSKTWAPNSGKESK